MSRKGSERSSLSNPYVGINRIRFDGFLSAFCRHLVENGSFWTFHRQGERLTALAAQTRRI